MTKYVAFLRGINVGGHHKVPMAELRTLLEDMEFREVKTLLASGNVILETTRANSKTLSKKIEKRLEDKFGKNVTTRNWNTVFTLVG